MKWKKPWSPSHSGSWWACYGAGVRYLTSTLCLNEEREGIIVWQLQKASATHHSLFPNTPSPNDVAFRFSKPLLLLPLSTLEPSASPVLPQCLRRRPLLSHLRRANVRTSFSVSVNHISEHVVPDYYSIWFSATEPILVATVWFSLSFPIRSRPSRYSCIRVNTLRSDADAVIEKLRPLVSNVSVAVQSEDGESNPLKECSEDASAPFSKCKIPGLDYVVFVWGSGPHRIDYGEAPPKEVVVSRKCAEAVLRGAQVGRLFANCQIMCFEELDWLLLVLVLALGVCSWCDGLQCSCWERRYGCGFGCCGAAGCWWGVGNSYDTWHCSPRIRDR